MATSTAVVNAIPKDEDFTLIFNVSKDSTTIDFDTITEMVIELAETDPDSDPILTLTYTENPERFTLDEQNQKIYVEVYASDIPEDEDVSLDTRILFVDMNMTIPSGLFTHSPQTIFIGGDLYKPPVSPYTGVCGTLPADTLTQGTRSIIDIVLKDSTGCPIDLSLMKVYYVASQDWDDCIYLNVQGSITDAPNGEIQFVFTEDVLTKPGAFLAAIQVKNSDGTLVFQQSRFLHVVAKLGNTVGGPLTIAEVRLFMRDACPSQNYLLDDVEFSDEEILLAMRRPIQQWNETPPRTAVYDTTSFPYRYYWSLATTANLLRIAAHNQRRNNLSVSAAGVTVNDDDSAPEYEAVADKLMAEWKEFMIKSKTSEVVASMWGTSRSGYSYHWGRY